MKNLVGWNIISRLLGGEIVRFIWNFLLMSKGIYADKSSFYDDTIGKLNEKYRLINFCTSLLVQFLFHKNNLC